jgi:hypothetical protein
MSNSFGTYRPGDGLQDWQTTFPPTVHPGPAIAGSGNPERTVPGNPGQAYTDTDTNNLWVKFKGVSVLGWQLVGKAPVGSTGSGGGAAQQVFYGSSIDPNGVITAAAPAYYYSLTDQSQWEKVNTGLNDSGWTKFLG